MNDQLANTKNTFSQFVSGVYRHIGQGKTMIRKAARKPKKEKIRINPESCANRTPQTNSVFFFDSFLCFLSIFSINSIWF